MSCLRILADSDQITDQMLIVKNVKAMSSFHLEVESKESQSTNSLSIIYCFFFFSYVIPVCADVLSSVC